MCILADWLNSLLTCYWPCCFLEHKLRLTLDGSVASPQTLTYKSWNFHPLHLPAHPPEFSRSAQLTQSPVHLCHPVYTLFISVYTHLVCVATTCFLVNKRIKVIRTTLLCTVELHPTPICYTEQFYEYVCKNSETEFQLGIQRL